MFRIRCGTLLNHHCSMTMSAENRSKFAALHRDWWCLRMSEILSSGTINSNKTKTKNQRTNCESLKKCLLNISWLLCWKVAKLGTGNAPAEYKDPIDVWVTWSKVKVKLLKKCCVLYIFWCLCWRMFSFLIAYGYLLSAASICTFFESWNRKPYDWENV